MLNSFVRIAEAILVDFVKDVTASSSGKPGVLFDIYERTVRSLRKAVDYTNASIYESLRGYTGSPKISQIYWPAHHDTPDLHKLTLSEVARWYAETYLAHNTAEVHILPGRNVSKKRKRSDNDKSEAKFPEASDLLTQKLASSKTHGPFVWEAASDSDADDSDDFLEFLDSPSSPARQRIKVSEQPEVIVID